MRVLPDEELLAQTPRRPAAFDEFYVRHEALLLGYFRRRVDSADLALDLTAETFVQALASVRRFRPGPEPAVAWLLLKSLRRGRVADRARRRLGVGAIAGDVAARLRCSPLVARKSVSRGLATLREIVDEESS